MHRPPARADVFVVNAFRGDASAAGSAEAGRLVYELRESGVRVERTYGDRSVKAQFKAADKSGARWTVVLGQDEASRDAVTVQDLRAEGNERLEVRRDGLAEWLEMRNDEANETNRT